jgi:PDZ domain-containing protein
VSEQPLAQGPVSSGGGTLKRRGATVVVGAVLVILLTVLVGRAPVPYVLLEPGPTYNTLGQDDQQHDIIVIDGAPTSNSAGQLRFLTVGVVSQLTLLDAVRGWLAGDDAVVPRELIFPADQSEEQVNQQNAEAFQTSLSDAQLAALNQLGYVPLVAIKEVNPDSPNASLIKAGDVITAVNGTPVDGDANKLLEAIRAQPVGSTLTFAITRDGAPQTVQVVTYDSGGDGVPRVGFTPEVRSSAPFTITFSIEGIGGPSAGMMLALGILDKLDPVDLTGGRIIAGTGTINPRGDVGPIGGLPQKMVAAKAVGATIFLTPKANCAEAVANAKPDLMLVQVSTLSEALDALATIRDGGTPTLCTG